MTTDDRSGFLHRWSRRKIEARERGTPDEDRPQQQAPAAEAAAAGDLATQDPARDEVSQRTSAASPTEGVSETGDRGAGSEEPPLTLQDVQALTRDSDFAPFMTRQVAPEVKNAALKKLFSDPHYNVMDGLDIYIDDYSNLEPLPAPMLRRLVSAQALKMFEADVEDGDSPRAEGGEADVNAAGSNPGHAADQAETEDKRDAEREQVASEADPAAPADPTAQADSTVHTDSAVQAAESIPAVKSSRS
ncbi:DUF3306 domain-containing protein [Bordetella genomosp. 4]|uniref:DUF3306 domain-containing protein n=1 Tax=Bordetella genomosp. 4 TaxID=463044 RepID=A0A261V3U3_9BORD|nr:DUF3306 domain-containing protein [Bordetella genomosp. 4]OZI67843.1 hypothetical protein CAL20_02070 [Bordetella genomosp. 4]